MFKYLLLFIIIEYDSTVISESIFFSYIVFFSNCICNLLDIDLAHAASFVRPEIWNWWDYSDGVSGPALWGYYFPLCDVGRFQSPINIESRHLIFDHQLTPISINNSDNVFFSSFLFLHKTKNRFLLGPWNPSK